MSEPRPIRFIGEPVQVEFDKQPEMEKSPPCPDAFVWDEERYRIAASVSEWRDYGRRGRMASNMREEHLSTARRRGSWGVGRFFYRVRTEGGRLFDLYYDRAPKSVRDRKGGWFLYRELEP